MFSPAYDNICHDSFLPPQKGQETLMPAYNTDFRSNEN